jgi:hypothetical protein
MVFPAVVFFSLGAPAATVTYDFNHEFSSGTPPASSTTPWLTAVFADTATAGLVTLTLTAPHLTGSEFVSGWYLNLNPILDPTQLLFSNATVGSGSFSFPTITEGVNAYKADGDGKYDVLLSFATSGGLNGNFTLGDTLTYSITGSFGGHVLSAADFYYLSAPSGGHGPFYSAAHVQGIGNGDSGWVEPSGGNSTPGGGGTPQTPDGGTTVLLLGSALVGLGLLRRAIVRH